MGVTRSIYAPNLDVEALVQALATWYRSQNLEVERLPGQTAMLQCREHQQWRKFVGMAMGLHVELAYSDPGLTVTISAGKWVDKAVVGGVALATSFGLLAIPAAYGYWQQRKLPDRTFSFIQEAIATQMSHNQVLAANNPQIGFRVSPPTTINRPRGNGKSDPMGADVTPDANTFPCPVCGTPNPVTAGFCRGCRTSLESGLEESAFKMKSTRGKSSMVGNANSNRPPEPANDSAPGSGSTVGWQSTTNKMVTCPKCGKQVALGKRFCGNCGLQLNKDNAGGTRSTVLASAPALQADGRTTFSGVVFVIDDSGQRINLPTRREVVIGRRDAARNYFPDVDLAPHKGETCGVSLEHARLRLQNGQIMLEDLDAPNGTWLGSERLLPGVPRPLRNDVKVRFGKVAVTILFS